MTWNSTRLVSISASASPAVRPSLCSAVAARWTSSAYRPQVRSVPGAGARRATRCACSAAVARKASPIVAASNALPRAGARVSGVMAMRSSTSCTARFTRATIGHTYRGTRPDATVEASVVSCLAVVYKLSAGGWSLDAKRLCACANNGTGSAVPVGM